MGSPPPPRWSDAARWSGWRRLARRRARRRAAEGAAEGAAGRAAGFTLVEILVSLALLALVLAAMPTALRLAAQAWGTSERLQQGSAREVATSFLSARIAEAMPLMQRDATGANRIAFRGAAQTLAFVAAARDGPSGAGLFAYELSLRGDDGQDALWLSWRRLPPPASPSSSASTPADWREEAAAGRVLVRDVSAFSLRYFGSENGVRQWSEAWSRADILPEVIELRLATRAERTPAPLVHIVLRLRDLP